MRFVFLALVLVACTDTRGGRDAAIVVGGPCGPVNCGDGERCCDHCTGTCVPEESGAFCPDDGDPDHACDGGATVSWSSCEEAHGRASDGDSCTFSGSCGNCCCEGSTSCSSGMISTALCDCLCTPDDAGVPTCGGLDQACCADSVCNADLVCCGTTCVEACATP